MMLSQLKVTELILQSSTLTAVRTYNVEDARSVKQEVQQDNRKNFTAMY